MSGDGFLIVLDRDHAKRLFGIKTDDAVREFVDSLTESAELRDTGSVLELGTDWDAIHRCLTDGTLQPDAGEYPLNHCILGGRPMYRGDDRIVSLKRPDVCQHIVEALKNMESEPFINRFRKLDETDYGRQPTEDELNRVLSLTEEISALYNKAADQRDAVLFAASSFESSSPTGRGSG